jgi:hypothetical protein
MSSQRGVEGIVAKRRDQAYRPGQRAWRKLKRKATAEGVVGAVFGETERPGALILGLPGLGARPIPARHDTCVHRRRQQLRAGHRSGHRDLRRHVRTSVTGVVGPLIEVPVLVALVYVSLAARQSWRAHSETQI